MELGTRMRYGIIAMIDLARRGQTEAIRAVDIANAAGISRGYLEGLLAALRRGGLVRALRGPGGGWQLTRPPSQVRPTQIYSVLEGTTALVRCADSPEACGSAKGCGARRLWIRMSKALEKALREETLAQMAGLVVKKARSTKKAVVVKKKPARKKRPKLKKQTSTKRHTTKRHTRKRPGKSVTRLRTSRPSARGRIVKAKVKLIKRSATGVRKNVVKAPSRLRKSA
jgi:Rrf2 family iron-sulfur cluster assembly transcriptional regulator